MANKYKLMQKYEITIRFHPRGVTSYVYSNGDEFNEDFESAPYEDMEDAISASMAFIEDEVQDALDENYESSDGMDT